MAAGKGAASVGDAVVDGLGGGGNGLDAVAVGQTILDDIRQGVGGGGLGSGIMHQHHVAPAMAQGRGDGTVDPARGGGGTGSVAAGYIPVKIGEALVLDPLGQTAHDAHAVLAADGVGAASGEAENGGLIPEVCPKPVPEPIDVLHKGLVTFVNGCIVVGVAVNGHGMPFVDHPADQSLTGLAVVDDEEGGADVIGLQSVQHPGRHPVAGAVIEGQVDGAGAGGGIFIYGHLAGGRGSVARLVGHGIGQGIDPGNGGVHSAGPADGCGQVAVGVILGRGSGILECTAQGNEQLPLTGQRDDRGYHVPDRHPTGGSGGISGLVGDGVGENVDVAAFLVRYPDRGGEITVAAVPGGGSRVLEQVKAGDGDLRVPGQRQLRGLPVLHMDQTAGRVALPPVLRLIRQGIVPGDLSVHPALHGDGGIGAVAAPQQLGAGVRVGSEGGDAFLGRAVELDVSGRCEDKIALCKAQNADDGGCQQQSSACRQSGDGLFFHGCDPPINDSV